ncbi:MAG: YihY/virulence factor BrkB family protein [Actinomycetota bacterium]
MPIVERVRARADRVAARDTGFARRVLRPALALADRVEEDQLGVEAGSLTYGAFLSLPPLLLLSISVVGIVFQQQAENVQKDLIDAVGDLLPGFDDVVSTQLELATASQIGTGLVGLVGIVYAASGFVARVRHALGAVFRTRRTGLVVGRLSGAVFGVPVVILLVGFATSVAWVTRLRLTGTIGVVTEVGALAVLAILGAAIWAMVYRLLTPSPGPSLREHLPGALVFTVGFLVLERFGAAYVTGVVTRSTALYGTIGAIFGLLAFLYATMWLFLLSAEISQLPRTSVGSAVTSDGA